MCNSLCLYQFSALQTLFAFDFCLWHSSNLNCATLMCGDMILGLGDIHGKFKILSYCKFTPSMSPQQLMDEVKESWRQKVFGCPTAAALAQSVTVSTIHTCHLILLLLIDLVSEVQIKIQSHSAITVSFFSNLFLRENAHISQDRSSDCCPVYLY